MVLAGIEAVAGDDATRLRGSADQESKDKSAFRPGEPESPERPGCRGWVDCVDGYWGNFRCTDGRFCRGGWEGSDNKASPVEKNALTRVGETSEFLP